MRATHGTAVEFERLLEGSLPASAAAELLGHLDDCPDCREAMESLAASPDCWQEARRLLRPGASEARHAMDVGVAEDGDTDLARETLAPEVRQILAALAPTDDPRMLGRIDGYEILGVVGCGGMGVVLKALDPLLDRVVAIKVLAPHLAASGAARQRFAREARATAAVIHPNVIAIHSVSRDEQRPYLVMACVRGASLQRRIDRSGPLDVGEALRIGAQIAAGLAAAHSQGLVHRDIKPANVLLEEGVERVAITDFGLARAVDDASLTRSGVLAGTPQYMSPEQARGEPVDARSDLFSLGSVLYTMCAGRPPFRAESTYGIIRRIVECEPTPLRDLNPEVPEWLDAVVRRLMAKRAGDRYATANEVSELLSDCLAHLQQPRTKPLPSSLCPSRLRAHSARSLRFRRSLGIIAMTSVLMLLVASWMSGPPDDSPAGGAPEKQPKFVDEPVAPTSRTPTGASNDGPRRIDYFTSGHDIRVACDPQGRRLVVANGNPTCILLVGGTSRPKGGWQPTVGIIDGATGLVLTRLDLLTAEEEAIVHGTTRVSHIEATALAVSADGTQVAVGTSIGQVKLFDAETGKLLRTLDDKEQRLADRDTPADWAGLPRAIGSVVALAFSPDGKQLVMAGTSFRQYSDRFDGVRRLGRSDSVTGPGRLKLWDLSNGELRHDLVGHGHVADVAFSPKGDVVVSVGAWLDPGGDNFGNGAIAWDPESGRKLWTLNTDCNGGANDVVISADGGWIAVGSSQYNAGGGGRSTRVALAHAATGVLDWQRELDGVAAPAGFTPDGKQLIVVREQMVAYWDLNTGEDRGEWTATDLSRDGRCQVVAVAANALYVGAVDDYEGEVLIAPTVGEEDGPNAANALRKVRELEDAANRQEGEDRARLLRRAVEEYARLYGEHRSQVIGLAARLGQGRCLAKLEADEQARKVLTPLLELPSAGAAVERIRNEARELLDEIERR